MKRPSEKSLSNVALHYLRKHSASRKGLVQLLERKIKRQPDVEPSQAKQLIAQVVARMVQAGYIDDARMAESKTASLHRQGKSSRAIEFKLREKGIDSALAKKSAISTPEREFEAACTLVKKKRLGVDADRRQKDFAVLMRAGFNSEVARRALLEAVEEEIDEGRVIRLPVEAARLAAYAREECQVIQLPVRQAIGPAAPSQLDAALELVNKKRLGVDPSRKQKDLAVLIRAGFKYDVAKQALVNGAQLTVPT